MSSLKRLLLVDSVALTRRGLAGHLRGLGFAVAESASAEEALAHLEGGEGDVLAAEGLPDILVAAAGPGGTPPSASSPSAASSLDAPTLAAFCARVRQRGFAGPLVVLVGGAGDAAALTAAGATLCLARPVRLAALAQKLQALSRGAAVESWRLGGLSFDPQMRLVVDGAGRSIRVTEKEAAILSYLYRAGDRVVPRDELLGEVWGYADGADTHTVQTHVYRLRRKLGGDLLRTEGGGYRLLATDAEKSPGA